MFQCYRLYRLKFIQCLPKECWQKNFPTTEKLSPNPHKIQISTHRCYTSSLAAPEIPFRKALFQYHPAHSIGLARLKGSLEDRLSEVADLKELLYVLEMILPKQANKNFVIRRKVVKCATAALEDCLVKTCKHANTLRDFNAIIERFHRVQMNVPSAMMSHGLKAAALANSPAAMEQYVAIIGPRTRKPCFRKKIKLITWEMIVRHIIVATRSMPPGTWKTLYQKRVWAKVVTGWDMGNAGRGKRQYSLYDALIQFGIQGLASYFHLMRSFCRVEDILQIWLKHELSVLSDANDRAETLNFIFNSYLQVLLAKNDPKRAWKVAQTTAHRFGAIQDRTWKLLLRYPEHIESWVPGMDKPIFDALEKYLFNIERQLGVRWTGGENGLHIAKGGN